MDDASSLHHELRWDDLHELLEQVESSRNVSPRIPQVTKHGG